MMLRYFEFGFLHDDEEKTFCVASDTVIHKFILKKIGFFLFITYSTFFAAAATPFVKPHYKPIYLIGFSISIFCLLRVINFIKGYMNFKNGKFIISQETVKIETDDVLISINYSDISFIEYNVFSDMVIHTDEKKIKVPYLLIKENDRKELSDILVDMTPERTALFKKTWEFFDAVLMAFILAIHIIQFIVQNYYIPSGSMEDTLMEGDHLFAEKITYGPAIPQMLWMEKRVHLKFLGIRDVQKKDIIIFRPPEPADQDKVYIKRCIAVEGDDFKIKNGSVYINGEKQIEPYTKGITEYTFHGGDIDIEGIVPKGKVIVLGDNRENSQDSRYFGYLDKDRIYAKALVLYFNLDQFRHLDFSRVGLIK